VPSTNATAPLSSSRVESRFFSGPAVVLYIATAKLLLHLLTASRYGIFRDELYYLACAEHLAWGYVDQPPLIAFVTWFARHIFGESLLGLRLLPAIAGASLVWLTGKLAAEMGGNRFAQTLAALSILPVPVYLILHHWLTMNAFEPLLWMGCVWCVVRAINTNNAKYFLVMGVLAGIGLENKYSIVFMVAGLLLGLLASPYRRFLKSRWFWMGAIAAFLIFLPNLVWLIQHHFPFLAFEHNVRMGNRDIKRAPLAFLVDQAVMLHPTLAPLWIGGLAWLLFTRDGRRYRVLGWAFLFVLGAILLLRGKNYYVAPVYPMLFAAGAIALERLTDRLTDKRRRFVRVAYVVLIVVTGLALAPTALPILPVETYIRYQHAIGLVPLRFENQPTGPLPQYFADEFGWEEMAQKTAAVYNSLSPEERAHTAIFGNEYGESAAIDFFGRKYGLPKSIGNHVTYWYWGPRDYTGDIVIVLGSDGRGDREYFRSVEEMGRTDNPYSRQDEHFAIYLCRGPKVNLQDAWPSLKKW
jgi:hypothetical protein